MIPASVSALGRAVLVIGAAAMGGGCLDLSGGCANEQLNEVPSPGGARRAVVFQRDCGATTPFSTQISVLPRGVALPDSNGNVFVADTDRGRAPAGPGGGPGVSVRWLTPDTLEVRYDPRARVFVKEVHTSEAEVRFVADSEVVR
jgi:hypothetical protein